MIIKDKFFQFLRDIKPENAVGIGGLAILGAASFFSLATNTNFSYQAIITYVSSLGLNVLASMLYSFFSSKDIKDESQFYQSEIIELAGFISKKMDEDEFRNEVNKYFDATQACQLAAEIIITDKISLSWLLIEITNDIKKYGVEFQKFEKELQNIEEDISTLKKQMEQGFIRIEKIFSESMLLWEKSNQEEYYKIQYLRIKTILLNDFTRSEIEKVCYSVGIDFTSIVLKLQKENIGTTNQNIVQELLKNFDTLDSLEEIIKIGREIKPKSIWIDIDKSKLAIWPDIDWKSAASMYIRKMQNMYGSLRLMGQNKFVYLEGVFTDVYFLDRPSSWRRFTLEEIQKLHAETFYNDRIDKRVPGLDVVAGNQRVFILGKPGAGKTTFLKYITIQATKGKLDRIPIFVSLKEYSDSVGSEVLNYHSLYKFIVKQFDICDFPDAEKFINFVLLSGKAMILLDGLDEINQLDGLQSKIISSIKNFSEKYSECQFIITCRVAATEYNFDQFIYVEMADFLESQIKEFSRKWFTPNTNQSEAFLTELYKADNFGLQELARNPLLLTLLCIVYEETLAFPQRRVEIYEEALDALFKKWDVHRGIKRDEIYKNLSLGRKKDLLTQIAYHSFINSELFMKEANLVDQIIKYLSNVPPNRSKLDIDGFAVLQSIEAQHGIIVERAKGIYSFAHLTYQEYFTSKYIVENQTLNSLTLLLDKFDQQNWREVFLLTTSLLPNADVFLTRFESRIAQLCKSFSPNKYIIFIANKISDGGINDINNRCWNIYRDFERAFYIAKTIEETGLNYVFASSLLSKSIEYLRNIMDILIPNEHVLPVQQSDIENDFDCYFVTANYLCRNYFEINTSRIDDSKKVLLKVFKKFNENIQIIEKLDLQKPRLKIINFIKNNNIVSSGEFEFDWSHFCLKWNKNFINQPYEYNIYNKYNILIIERFMRCINLFVNCLDLSYSLNYSDFVQNLLSYQ